MSLLMRESLEVKAVVDGSGRLGSNEVRSNSVIVAKVSAERPKVSDQS